MEYKANNEQGEILEITILFKSGNKAVVYVSEFNNIEGTLTWNNENVPDHLPQLLYFSYDAVELIAVSKKKKSEI